MKVFMVADTQAGKWIGRFAQPADAFYEDNVCISPDGRYFAAAGFAVTPAYIPELAVYDLSSLPHEEMDELELR